MDKWMTKKAVYDSVNNASLNSQRDRLKWYIFANICVGTFMVNLESGIVSVSLPTLSSVFNVSIDVIQWVVTAYLLTICALLPIMGKISDSLGKGRIYNIGFLIFTIGAALSAMSVSMGMLIAAKMVQAVGGSCVMANNQGLIADTFDVKERGRALGFSGIAVSMGALSGPAVGGVILEYLGWRAVFWVVVPIGIIGVIAGWKTFPKARPQSEKLSFDYLGSALFMIGTPMLLYAISNATTWGWTSAPALSMIIGAFIILCGFYLWERRTANPMLDFSLYKIRMFTTGTIASFMSYLSVYFMMVMMPFYLQIVLEASPEQTGYVMAAYPLAMALTTPIAGRISDFARPVIFATSGMVLSALGFLSFLLLSVETSLWTAALLIAIIGVGTGIFQPANINAVLGSVPLSRVGLAGGLNALMRNFGMTLGVAVATSMFTSRLQTLTGESELPELAQLPKDTFVAALHDIFLAAAVICVIGAIFSVMRGNASRPVQQVEAIQTAGADDEPAPARDSASPKI